MPRRRPDVEVLGISGWSGCGKTTLIVALIPRLRARGLRVSTLKHAHHDVDLDTPGKDTWRHREAGAHETMLATGRRWALLRELREEPEPTAGRVADPPGGGPPVSGAGDRAGLLQVAIRRAFLIAEQAGMRAMMTHPLDEDARRFYLSFGFMASPLRDNQLLLLLKNARRLVRG